MISKPRIVTAGCALLAVCALTLHVACSRNPVDIDNGDRPAETNTTFPTFNIRSMIDLGESRYLAENGSSVQTIRSYGTYTAAINEHFVDPIPGHITLFIDPLGVPSLLTDSRLYQWSDSNTMSTVFTIDQSVPCLRTARYIDDLGRAFFVSGGSGTFTVWRYDGDSTVRLFSEELPFPIDTIVSFMIAAQDTVVAIAYTLGRQHIFLRVYRNNHFDTEFTARSPNYIPPAVLCELGIVDGEPVMIGGFGGTSTEQLKLFRLRYESLVWYNSSVLGDYQPDTYLAAGSVELYRSRNELWLRNRNGYAEITTTDFIWHSFRQSSVNRFDVICVDRAGSAVFYDDATRRFVTMP